MSVARRGISPVPKSIGSLQEPGAAVLRCYELMSQLAGIYAHAASIDRMPEMRMVWVDIGEKTLRDLGAVFRVWEHARARAKRDNAQLIERLNSSGRRLHLTENLITLWVPLARVARIASRWEKRMAQMFTEVVQNVGIDVTAECLPLIKEIEDRASRLLVLEKQYRLWEFQTNTRYRVPSSLTADLVGKGGK